MKKFKKLASILLAAAMVLAMTVPAMAATVTISEDNNNVLQGHKFAAYQIFSGTQADDSSVLGDVEWGSGINKEKIDTLMNDLKAIKDGATSPFESCESAAAVAEKLGGYKTDSDVAKAFAKAVSKALSETKTEVKDGKIELSAGYYLFVDETDPEGDVALNTSLLQVTNDNIEIRAKTDKPFVEKKVQENEDGVIDGDTTRYVDAKYNDVADYNIGNDVPFAFYAPIPDMTYYDTYKYVFHDTMAEGLSFNNDVSIDVLNAAGDKIGTINGVTATESMSEGETFTVTVDDLKVAVKGMSAAAGIRVNYTAKLNENAKIGLPGNENKVYLEYSNNPNDEGTGKTTEDKVIVFTYELDVEKIDAATAEDVSKKALKDAEFVLYRKNGGKVEYVVLDSNKKVSTWINEEPTKGDDGTISYPEGNMKLVSDENGLFSIKGLDEGTYYLKETKAPAGYNLLTKDIEVIITATDANGQNWLGDPKEALTQLDVMADGKSGTGMINQDNPEAADDGTAKIVVGNNAGVTLPETGGIGTTIFYVLGSILVLAAVIVLVTKKRMSAE